MKIEIEVSKKTLISQFSAWNIIFWILSIASGLLNYNRTIVFTLRLRSNSFNYMKKNVITIDYKLLAITLF